MDSPFINIAPEVREAILRFDTCKVANAIESLGIRLKNEGFTRPGLRCVSGCANRALGYAVTAKVKCSDPPIRGSHSYYDLGDWWEIMSDSPRPRIAVIEDMDSPPGMGAVLSDTHAHVLSALNCDAVVTNGAVRDIGALADMGFSAFAGSVGVSHSYVHMVAYSCPVEIHGLGVAPGDLVYADVHGMIQIPVEAAPDLVRVLEERAVREAQFIELCKERQPLSAIRQAAREL